MKNQCEDCVRKLDDWIAKKMNMVLSIGMFIDIIRRQSGTGISEKPNLATDYYERQEERNNHI